ncbi:MAG TPA: DUF5666 domain-containing protein [Acidisarcina sp.]
MKIRSFQKLCLIALATATLSLTMPAIAQDGMPGGGMQGGGGPGRGMGMGRGVRGTVTAINGKQVSIKTDEGDVYTVITGDNTRLFKDREQAAITDIHVGDMLMAGGEVDAQAKTVGAAFVAIVDAEQVRKMREQLGKTWISGKITGIEDTKITIMRMDGVSQTIAVDENTSFHKRRDSITMADIKVGDPVNARGALKDGVFVAAQLGIGGMAGGMGPGGFGGPGGPGGHGDHHAPDNTAPQQP